MSRLNYMILIIISSACSKPSIIDNHFIGTWTSVDKVIPYRAILTISKDSTFVFWYGACQVRGYSQGTWKLFDNKIILNSLATDSCYFVEEFGFHCYPITDTLHWVRKTREKCDPAPDEFYSIFKDEQFEIRNDTLIHEVEISNNCPDIQGMNDNFTKKRN